MFLVLLTLLFSRQMLSMRNGLSLHPMCLPDGVQPIRLPQMRMDFDVGNRSEHLNTTTKSTATHVASTLNIFVLPNQCSVSNQPMVSNMSNIFNSEISFRLESSIWAHLGPLHLQIDAEVGLLFETNNTYEVKRQ